MTTGSLLCTVCVFGDKSNSSARLPLEMPDHPCLLVEAKNGPVEKVVVALAVLSRDPLISKPEVLSVSVWRANLDDGGGLCMRDPIQR